MPTLADVKRMRTAMVPHGFEPRSLDSEPKVLLTVTPQVTIDWSSVTQRDSASRHRYLGVATEGTRAYRCCIDVGNVVRQLPRVPRQWEQ